MTCIVGLVERSPFTGERRVVLGGDSAGTEIGATAEHQLTEASSKVYRVGAMVFGMMGSARVAQVVRRSVAPRARFLLNDYEAEYGHLVGAEVEAWVVDAFIPLLRDQLKKQGALEVRKREQVMNGVLLLGIRGHLFCIYSDFAASEPVEGYYAVGTGRDVALGALHAQAHDESGTPLSERLATFVLLEALEAAAEYVPSVRGPFSFAATSVYYGQAQETSEEPRKRAS